MAYYPSKEFYDNALENLDNCYRSDRYVIGNKKETDIADEYFLVAGPHSIIHIYGFAVGSSRIFIHGKEYVANILDDALDELSEEAMEYSLNICDALVNCFNKIRKNVMILDYCVSELRKLPKKEAVKSSLFEYKSRIEKMLIGESQDLDFELPKALTDKIQEECDLLTDIKRAVEEGKITENMAEKITNREELSKTISEEMPIKGFCKQHKIYTIGSFNIKEEDPLERVRDLTQTLDEQISDPSYDKDMDTLRNLAVKILKTKSPTKLKRLSEKFGEAKTRVVAISIPVEAPELNF